MKRFLYACCLLLSISVISNAQVKWGAKQGNKYNNSSKRVLAKAEDEENIYIIKKNNPNFVKQFWVIEAVSKKNKEVVFSTYLVNPVNAQQQTTQWSAIIVIGSKLYLFSSLYDNTRVLRGYATVIDKTTGLNEETKLIYTASIRDKDIPFMQYALSPDKTKLLISCSPFDITNNEFKIIDKNLSTVWQGHIMVQDGFKALYDFHSILDNNNNISLWLNGYSDAKIIVYTTRNGQSKTLNVPVPKTYGIYCEMMKFYDSTKVYFVALLNTKNNGVTTGMISAMIDLKNQEYLNSQTTIFTESELDATIGVNRGWKPDFMGLFYLKNIFFRPNGTITILTEQGYKYEGGLYPGNLILALNVSLRGHLNWINMIPKYHDCFVEEYMSFVAASNNNSIYMVYNDNPANINAPYTKRPELMNDPYNSVAVMTAIDDNGNTKTTPFFWSEKSLGFTIKPSLCSPLKNSFFLFSENLHSCRLGEILFF